MNIYATLIAKTRSLCLIVGSVVISYCIATFIAWVGAQYYGDLQIFMEAFRAAAGYLAALRILIYGGLIYIWAVWKRKLLLQSESPDRSKQNARRIELSCAGLLVLMELTAWQFAAEGGAL